MNYRGSRHQTEKHPLSIGKRWSDLKGPFLWGSGPVSLCEESAKIKDSQGMLFYAANGVNAFPRSTGRPHSFWTLH